jgi:hypothetical protein
MLAPDSNRRLNSEPASSIPGRTNRVKKRRIAMRSSNPSIHSTCNDEVTHNGLPGVN